MSNPNKRPWGCAVVLCVVGLGLVTFIVNSINRVREETQKKLSRRRQEEKKRLEKGELLKSADRRVAGLVKKHGAVSDWAKLLEFGTRWDGSLMPARDFLSGSVPYTLTTQKALLGDSARPLILFGRVIDIEEDQETFSISLFDWSEPRLIFVLQCSSEQAESLVLSSKPLDSDTVPWGMKEGELRHDAVAVIATIISVQRGTFRGPTVYLEQILGDVLVARGRCLEFVDLMAMRTASTSPVPPPTPIPASDLQ